MTFCKVLKQKNIGPMRTNRGHRYHLSFHIVDTEQEARSFCDQENATATPYIRKNKPAHYTPWNDPDSHYICWFYR